MISDPKIAAQTSELMLDLFRRVDESCQLVRETCSKEDAAACVSKSRW
jgi:hypothetical protein